MTPKGNFEGIIVYTITNECLSGYYTNTVSNSGNGRDRIYNEIARKDPNGPAGIVGTYDCSWIDTGATVNGKLEITWNNSHYRVIWNDGNKDVFEGTGFLLGNMFAVHYTTI